MRSVLVRSNKTMIKIPIYQVKLKNRQQFGKILCTVYESEKALLPIDNRKEIREKYETNKEIHLRDTESDFNVKVTKSDIEEFEYVDTEITG